MPRTRHGVRGGAWYQAATPVCQENWMHNSEGRTSESWWGKGGHCSRLVEGEG